MALIKCTECGQEVSTEARMCPHCGKPTAPIVIEKARKKSGVGKVLLDIFLVTLLILVVGYVYLIKERSTSYSGSGTFEGNMQQNLNRGNYKQVFADIFGQQTIKGTMVTQNSLGEIPLQEVKNLSYDFYVGQIDSPNNSDITDDIKNQITKIAYDAHFPVSQLRNVPIIILNNLALTGNQYIPTVAGNLKVPDLKPDFLSEGGFYSTYDNGSTVVYINKPIIAQGRLVDVLTHELGHAVGSKLTDADWKKFYQLRNIPSSTPRQGTSWNLSPQEDFAEVYKNTFTGIDVQTYYGQLVPSMGLGDMGNCMSIYFDLQRSYMDSSRPQIDPNDPSAYLKSITNPVSIDFTAIESKITTDPKMQSCRRDVMANPSKYPSDWQYGTPYKSSVGPQTKSFINEIMSKLN